MEKAFQQKEEIAEHVKTQAKEGMEKMKFGLKLQKIIKDKKNIKYNV